MSEAVTAVVTRAPPPHSLHHLARLQRRFIAVKLAEETRCSVNVEVWGAMPQALRLHCIARRRTSYLRSIAETAPK
jgi:hypothetical protein